jgi:hypothetical protein
MTRNDHAWLALVIATLLGVCALTFLVLGGVGPQSAFASDRDCADFDNQRQAQRFFHRHRPHRDPHNLDSDNDGRACESNPCPCSGSRWKGVVDAAVFAELKARTPRTERI